MREPAVLAPPLSAGRLNRTDIVRFAGACGDFNPIHHDEPHAVGLGHPAVFAMGMLTAGMLGAYVTSWAPLDEVREFSVRFTAPVWPGEELRFDAAEPVASAGGQRWTLQALGDGRPLVTGSVRVGGSQLASAPAAQAGEEVAELAAVPFEPVVLPVERGKVMEVARAVHAVDPVHLDPSAARAAGWPDLPAPLVFTAAAAHWSKGDASDVPVRLGMDLTRTVHGEQHWRFVRTPVAGDELTGTRRVTSAVRKTSRSGASMLIVRVTTEWTDAASEPVLGEDMIAIERGR
ncbi:MAG TPA: MaoC family dehydratase N-terminal domain-containing protein [Amycolatopsis sp.]|nr:MaoC family dehydratase N-terminal domain-containing protein [Amycolatopsis sp.]